MANPDLPQEILLEIFSRFPAKSVGKCRTLSKFWNTHLLTKTFINKHLITRQQTIQQQNIALTTTGREVCIITSPTTNDEVVRNNRGFRNEEDKWSSVIGSCNGLILLKERENLLLVNPITLKQVTVQPHPLGDLKMYTVEYGFGYDSFADDYKVVTITTMSTTTFADVYPVKTRVWKRVDYPGLIPSRYAAEGGAFINGAVHWLIRGRGRFHRCIAAFDLANEVFREIGLPYGFVKQTWNVVSPRTSGVSVVGGCLLIVDNFGNGNTDIWIMKEYGVAESWARFRIVAKCNEWLSIKVTLCYVEGGELLIVTNRNYLCACDLERGTVRKVLLPGRNNVGELLFVTHRNHLLACDLNRGTVRNVFLRGRNNLFANGMAFVDSLVSPEGSM